MNADFISKVKELEDKLAEKEKIDSIDIEKKGFGKEIANMSSSDPSLSTLINTMKNDRILYENKLRVEAFHRELKASKKNKIAKKLEQTIKKANEFEKDSKFKKATNFVGKVNKDINDAKYSMGKILSYIDLNENSLSASPRVYAKMQRIKRMITAFYYGLANTSIKVNASDISEKE